MALITRIVSRCCVYSGFAALCERRRRTSRVPTATILAYHRVGQPESDWSGLDSQLLSIYLRHLHPQIQFRADVQPVVPRIAFAVVPTAPLGEELQTAAQIVQGLESHV